MDCVEDSFEAVKKLKKADVDLLFVLLTAYVPSAVCAFLARWCEAGPTHHLALGVGHYMNTLRKFSRISGIELVEVK